MSEHTPGPWTADYEVFIKLWGEWVTEVRGPSGMDVIAIVNLGRNEKRPQLKNVSLIEAAPDLLAALEQVKAWIREDEQQEGAALVSKETLNNRFQDVRAAISKAKGTE